MFFRIYEHGKTLYNFKNEYAGKEMTHLLHQLGKFFLLGFCVLVSSRIFASVTIEGYLYNTVPNTQAHFSTLYPDSIQASSVIPYNQLKLIIINTAALSPHTVLFTLSDDHGNSCDIGITSVYKNTQFEIIHTTSKAFCVIAPAPNYLISITPAH
jgi:hypothetical protein